jgi:hypothetical protein
MSARPQVGIGMLRAEASPSLVDGAGLEYRFAGNRIEGSNPSASAERAGAAVAIAQLF